MLAACASKEFRVNDEHFFADKHDLGKGYIQYVEFSEKVTVAEPSVSRFRKNCLEAEAAARVRFKTDSPTSKDEGRRISEHFEKNAGCRVRMAFRKG